MIDMAIYAQDENALPYLSNLAAQVQMWLTTQFEHLQFRGLDKAEKIDLRPFFTTFSMRYHPPKDFSPALEICGSLPVAHQPQQGIVFNLSHQTIVLCYIMAPSVVWFGLGYRSWFFQVDLLGPYAMTTEHYRVALQHVVYYLIQLPKETLLEIFHGPDTLKDIVPKTPVMSLIYQVLGHFLKLSQPTTDLYFLVALAEPVMYRITVWCSPGDYLRKVGTCFMTSARLHNY